MAETNQPDSPMACLRQKLRSSLCLPFSDQTKSKRASGHFRTSSSSGLISHDDDHVSSPTARARARSHRRRRSSLSADFSYDPHSYSLNFDDGSSGLDRGEFRVGEFASRLPHSPSLTSPDKDAIHYQT